MISRKPVLILAITLTLIFIVFVLYQFTLLNSSNFVFGALENKSIPDFNFAAAGDWGCSSNAKNTVDNMIRNQLELVLGLGDFGYGDTDCWLELIKPISEKVKIAIGNHEQFSYETTTDFSPAPQRLNLYMNYFNLTRQFYSFNYQNVHFVAMSTEIPYERDTPQYNFVQSDLQKAASNSSIDWIVVFYHRVAYASPSLIHPIKEIRNTYHPLFEKYGVDLVLQGHAHNYQRSYPITFNSNIPPKPIVVSNDKTNYNNSGGQIFAIVGTGGARDIQNFTGPAAPYTAVQFIAYGFLNIDILNNGTVLDGKFYENNGTTKDHFTIVKTKQDKEAKSSSSESPSSPKRSTSSSSSDPILVNGYDSNFRIETVVKGLPFPSDFAFLGPQDILVLDQRNGTVQRVINGNILGEPLLDVSVANKVERGLLGAAVLNAENDSKYVFLYYTESRTEGSDICPKLNTCTSGTEPIGNRLYSYELTKDGVKLINPKLLLDLPATPGPGHNGGKMIFDADRNLLIIVGDIMGNDSKAQNYKNGKDPMGTGGILKIDLDSSQNVDGILGDTYPLNLYYAYGIRNGFGLDFDPVTGNLWDTENGPTFGDEINLVKQGFNSGWKDIQGIWNHESGKPLKGPLRLDGLEDFNGKGEYSDPEFTWSDTVGPTGIKFFNSDRMGPQFKNSMFVADINNGNIYHFNLNGDRSSLLLNRTLSDKKADTPAELNKIIFAKGFDGITDLEVGPDGYLYVLAYGIKGAIYKIVPIA
jgi:glucose/arabinose dehydrogenase